MRTALARSSSRVYYGHDDGTRGWSDSRIANAGLRVAFQLIYNPESKLVKGCEEMEQESLVFEDENGPEYSGDGQQKKIKGKAPIVVFGGKKCIWLNKEECESGKDKTMKLWTLELIAKAEPISEKGTHNRFAKARKLVNQCTDELLDGANNEEKAMLIKVHMSGKDDYNNVTPLLSPEQQKIADSVAKQTTTYTPRRIM